MAEKKKRIVSQDADEGARKDAIKQALDLVSRVGPELFPDFSARALKKIENALDSFSQGVIDSLTSTVMSSQKKKLV